MKIRKILLSLIYAVITFFIGWIFYAIMATHILTLLYQYKPMSYSNQLDSIFSSELLNLKVRKYYQSGARGSIYYLNVDELSNIVVIESQNFKDIVLNELQYKEVRKIDVSQNTAYYTITYEPFPLVQQALNPRKFKELKVSFEEPSSIIEQIINEKFVYFKGNFKISAFGNTKKCSIIYYPEKLNNEILILKHSEKIYFIMQSNGRKSLLEFYHCPN